LRLRQRWEESAREWIAWARPVGHDHFFWELNLPAFLPLLPPPSGRCLDLGCGEGRVGRALAARGFDVTGIDGSATLARAAATAAEGHRGMVGVADAAALPFGDQTFDLVVAFMSFQDVEDLGQTVTEVARVLRDGGTLCAATVHPFFSSGLLAPPDRSNTHGWRESYYATRTYAETVKHDGLAVTLHSIHRPLEAHTEAVIDAGLVLDTLHEPRPTPDYLDAHPDAAFLEHVPLYLHYRAHKR
jgi:SAM-dependent methyltransferase